MRFALILVALLAVVAVAGASPKQPVAGDKWRVDVHVRPYDRHRPYRPYYRPYCPYHHPAYPNPYCPYCNPYHRPYWR